MRRYSWFKAAMRLVGILLIGMALPMTAVAVVQLVYAYVGFSPGAFGSAVLLWMVSFVPSVVQLAIGCYLLFGGKWLVRRCLRDIDSTCPMCAYDLSGTNSDTCPECGFCCGPVASERGTL